MSYTSTTRVPSGAKLSPHNSSDSALAAAQVEKAAHSFSWPLFILCWPTLYWLHNELDAPSQPYDAQSLSDIVQGAQTGNSLARIVIVALGLLGVFLLVRYRTRIYVRPRIACVLFAFLVWTAMTVAWSTDPSLSTRRIVSLMLMTIFAAGCAVRMSTFPLSEFMAYIPAVSLIPGVLAELYYGTFKPLSNEYRFGGTAPHPNVEGATLAVACILLCWLSWQQRGTRRVLAMLALPILGLFLILSGSRTALIAMLLALGFSFVLVLLRDHRRVIPLIIASMCLVIALSALLLVFASDSESMHNLSLMQTHGEEGNATSLNGRADLWKALLIYANKRPWRGYGYGSFWTPQRIENISGDQGWTIQQSHSAYIEQLLALGIPGALLYVSLLVLCLWQCSVRFLRHRDGYGAWAAVLVFMLIHNLTESIDVNPGYTNVVFFLIVSHIAMVRADLGNEGVPVGSPQTVRL